MGASVDLEGNSGRTMARATMLQWVLILFSLPWYHKTFIRNQDVLLELLFIFSWAERLTGTVQERACAYSLPSSACTWWPAWACWGASARRAGIPGRSDHGWARFPAPSRSACGPTGRWRTSGTVREAPAKIKHAGQQLTKMCQRLDFKVIIGTYGFKNSHSRMTGIYSASFSVFRLGNVPGYISTL